jgi:hypothetical protein
VRVRIAEALSEEPHASLRGIAAKVGAAPETVRSVKAQLKGNAGAGDDRAEADARNRMANSEDGLHVLLQLPAVNSRLRSLPSLWVEDTACGSGTNAAGFANWFDDGSAARNRPQFVEAVPLSRAYEVADQSRAYAEAWSAFAAAVEDRTHRHG